MNIGIIVHSQTGNTLKFGQKIAAKLQEAGHKVEVVELKTSGKIQPGGKNIIITNIPDCSRFDTLLIGGPVWGGAPTPVVITCINSLKGIKGKKVLPFVTHSFPFPSMGGKQAVSKMKKALCDMGASVLPEAIISRLFRNADRLMDDAASQILTQFSI